MNPDEMHEPKGACEPEKCQACPDRERCPLKAMLMGEDTPNIEGGENVKVMGAKLEGERAAIAMTFFKAAQTLPLPILLSWENQVYTMIRANEALSPLLNILKAAASKQPEEPKEHPPEEPPSKQPEDTANDGGSIFDRMNDNLRDGFERN